MSDRRRIAFVGDQSRLDLAVPSDDGLGDALSAVGVALEPGRHLLVTRAGVEVPLDTRVSELDDGTLLSVVDLAPAVPRGRRRPRGRSAGRTEHNALWWLLGTAGLLLAATALIDLALGGVLFDPMVRMVTAMIAGLGALAAAILWALRAPEGGVSGAVALLAPTLLAFAAGVVVIPPLESAPQLAVTTGLLAAAVLAITLTVIAPSRALRGVAGTTALLLLVLAGFWGFTLMLGWSPTAAAALSLGLVAPGLRLLPSTLLNLPEGYAIDYKHFMSARWTVRGVVPDEPGLVTMDAVRPVVDESTARLAAGTIVLSLLAPLVAPIVLVGLTSPDPFVLGGTIGLLVATVLALVLVPRHTTSAPLRWTPRAAAAVVVFEVVLALSAAGEPMLRIAVAVGLLLAAVVSIAVIVPIGRGAASLAWSRLADVLEWVAVALAFPAALLAADALEQLRGMMSG